MRGRIGKETPPKTRYGFMAIPPSQKTIGLFEWEVSLLRKKAEEFSLSFKAMPDAIFWDEVSKIPLVTLWNLDHDNCPFLSTRNLCRVHTQKPLICQAYPLRAFGIVSAESGAPISIELADCPNVVPLPFPKERLMMIRYSTFFQELVPIYGSTFLGMLRLDGASKFIRYTLENLEKEGIIKRAILRKEVLKAILKNKPIGLFEYLRKMYPDIERILTKNIEEIYEFSLADLKQMIKKR